MYVGTLYVCCNTLWAQSNYVGNNQGSVTNIFTSVNDNWFEVNEKCQIGYYRWHQWWVIFFFFVEAACEKSSGSGSPVASIARLVSSPKTSSGSGNRQRQSSGVVPGKRKRSTREKSVETDLHLKTSITVCFTFESVKIDFKIQKLKLINLF